MKQRWRKMSGPLKIGLVIGLLGALLTVVGLLRGDFAPLTLRTLLLGILLGGGSWGLVSWAIASAAADATRSTTAAKTETAAATGTAESADRGLAKSPPGDTAEAAPANPAPSPSHEIDQDLP